MKNNLNGYDLSRSWFDFCFKHPDKIKPNHSAVYFFAIEHCNRLGWKEKFGFPTTMVMEAIGIKSYNTYINTLNELVEWKFIKMIERSKNQYSANIIALSNNDKALDKALDKAFIKHATKQSESTSESIDSIDKQETNKPLTKNQKQKDIILEILKEDKYNEIIFDFIEHRKSLKSVMTEKALSIFLKKLSKMSSGNFNKAKTLIETAIERGWKTVYPEKEDNNPKNNYSGMGESDPEKVKELINQTKFID